MQRTLRSIISNPYLLPYRNKPLRTLPQWLITHIRILTNSHNPPNEAVHMLNNHSGYAKLTPKQQQIGVNHHE